MLIRPNLASPEIRKLVSGVKVWGMKGVDSVPLPVTDREVMHNTIQFHCCFRENLEIDSQRLLVPRGAVGTY